MAKAKSSLLLLLLLAWVAATSGCQAVAPLCVCCTSSYFQVCEGQIVEPTRAAAAPESGVEPASSAPVATTTTY